ncbi:MAG: radical SAM protein [Chthoniobacterales bacterium]
MFSFIETAKIGKALLMKDRPLYVQFYITARCNLACQQCNIIYANSDVREATIDEIKRIADNLAEIGTCVVLLTGGEPFARADLPEIIRAFTERNIHVRMQTNGLASEEALRAAVDAGGHDISISLDTLLGSKQDYLNGEVNNSWKKALTTMSTVTKILPKKGSFAALGCVLSHRNLYDVANVLRFAKRIGWYVSLVPAHIAQPHDPRGFRSYDQSLIFPPEKYPLLEQEIENIKRMKHAGYPLYDSEIYLDDIVNFIEHKPLKWRSRNKGVCDSPTLYFAIIPNGDIAVCCDHRLQKRISTFSKDFPQQYRSGFVHGNVVPIAKACDGCLYGSYPEITTTARFYTAMWDHAKILLSKTLQTKPWPLEPEDMIAIADEIIHEYPTPEDATPLEVTA